MKYTAEDLINELYSSNPNYHKFTLEEFSEICLTPLAFFKKNMKDPSLPTVRFKHLGMFIVYPGIVAKIMHHNQERLDKGTITRETYDILNNQMEEIHKQLTTRTYKRGKVNIIYYDGPIPEEREPKSEPLESLQQEQA